MAANDLYPEIDPAKVAAHLSAAVRCQTVSYADVSRMEGAGFLALHQVLAEAFPLVHSRLEKEVVNRWSLLFRWKGSDGAQKPILFMGHLDTVPVTPGTEEDWTHPPFSGAIADGFVWGRGAVDCKSLVIGHLEAAEYLLSKGYTPKRDIYFAFGHDEESCGCEGAEGIMNLLKSRGISLEFVLDEGGSFTEGDKYGAPGVLLATVGSVEKGYADVKLQKRSIGGHSSKPGPTTALGDMARAIVALEDHQMAAGLPTTVAEFLTAIAPKVTEEPLKTLLSDISANQAAILTWLSEKNWGNAMIRTTTAATQCAGSPAPNVLPQKVEAVFNFRISPLDSVDGVLTHVKQTVGEGIDVTLIKGQEPSKTSGTDSAGYGLLCRLVGKFYPTAVVVPQLVTGGTDCRYFEEICDHCYRFRPFIGEMYLPGVIHSTDERALIEGQVQGIRFLIEMISQMGELTQ